MKCFLHREADAVGLCKACFRAVCGECLVEVPGGVCCKGKPSCEQRIALAHAVIERNRATQVRLRQGRFVDAIVRGIMAVALLGLAEWCREAGAPFAITIAAATLPLVRVAEATRTE
jgi:hypothetical protein